MAIAPRRNILFAALLSPVLPVLGAEAGAAPCEPAVAPEVEKLAILKVIAAMQDAWNRGEFSGLYAGISRTRT